MTSDDALLQFAEAVGADEDTGPPWRVLVVDDEPDVHKVTELVIANLRFQGRGIELLSAYSGAEARRLLERERDIAVVLLDVVMENDAAGLTLVGEIRRNLGLNAIRILLRTGQPGQAPERKVVLEMDIDNYLAKTELSADKLYTALIAALRGYDDLRRIEAYREAAYSQMRDQMILLERVLEAMPGAAGITDGTLSLTAANQPFFEALGAGRDEMIGETLEDRLPGLAAALPQAADGAVVVVDGFRMRRYLSGDGRLGGFILVESGADLGGV